VKSYVREHQDGNSPAEHSESDAPRLPTLATADLPNHEYSEIEAPVVVAESGGLTFVTSNTSHSTRTAAVDDHEIDSFDDLFDANGSLSDHSSGKSDAKEFERVHGRHFHRQSKQPESSTSESFTRLIPLIGKALGIAAKAYALSSITLIVVRRIRLTQVLRGQAMAGNCRNGNRLVICMFSYLLV
jgi:hypothetical protein